MIGLYIFGVLVVAGFEALIVAKSIRSREAPRKWVTSAVGEDTSK